MIAAPRIKSGARNDGGEGWAAVYERVAVEGRGGLIGGVGMAICFRRLKGPPSLSAVGRYQWLARLKPISESSQTSTKRNQGYLQNYTFYLFVL